MKYSLLSIAYKLYKLKEDISAKLFLRTPKTKQPSNKKLLIIKTDAIGDYILFRNFIEKVKKSKKYEGYEIHFLGNIAWKNIFDHLDKKYVDHANFLNLKPLYYGGNKYRKKILDKFEAENFDTIIYPAYSRNSIIDIIISKINAKNKIAFSGDDVNMSYFEKPFTNKFYTKLIKTNQKFEFNRNKDFFEQILGKKFDLLNPKINIKKKQGNYFVVNPGVSVKSRQWRPENFARVIDYLIEKYRAKIYIIGSKSELELDNKVKELSKHKNKIEIKNDNPLYYILTLIAGSRGVISNDTSTPYMAVALGKKVYCVAGKIGYGRMHPYLNYKDAIYFYPPGIDKIKKVKNYHKDQGLDDITTKEVISKLQF